MADYDDYQLPGYRYDYGQRAGDSEDEDCYRIQEDNEDDPPRQEFHDLLGFDEAPPAPVVKKAVSLDDVPVKGAGKTFEQILEEKIRTEYEAPTQRTGVPKREFLRKNSGLQAKTAVSKPAQEEEEQEDPQPPEDYAQTAKPKQTYLKRGEGKICIKPTTASEPPAKPVNTAIKPAASQGKTSTSTLKSTPAPSKQPVKTTPKPAVATMKKDPVPVIDDEIQICRDELITEAVAIRPRLKEKPPMAEKVVENNGLEEKVHKLDFEIEQMKAKNSEDREKIAKTERQVAELDEELNEFLAEKDEKIAELEHWKEEEFRRIKAERRAIESKLQPAKRGESEELESLRLEVARLQEEMAATENKRKNTLDSIKATITVFNTENRVLESELKELEKRRVAEGWTRRKPVDARRGRNGQY